MLIYSYGNSQFNACNMVCLLNGLGCFHLFIRMHHGIITRTGEWYHGSIWARKLPLMDHDPRMIIPEMLPCVKLFERLSPVDKAQPTLKA